MLKIHLILRGNHSLKGKRKVINRLRDRIQNHFSASVAEVAEHDAHEIAVVGVALVGNEESHTRVLVDKVAQAVDGFVDADVSRIEREVVHFEDAEFGGYDPDWKP